MNLDRLNRWLSLVANVGVLCGLVVLVLELNQNRDIVRAQTRNEVAMGFIDLAGLIATNPQLANVIRRGDAGEELTIDEQFQHRRFTLATYRYYESAHYQYRQGLYDEVEFAKQKEAWRSYAARSPGAVRIWCEVRGVFSPEFVADVGPSLGEEECKGTSSTVVPPNKPLKLTAAAPAVRAAEVDTQRGSITRGRSLAAIR